MTGRDLDHTDGISQEELMHIFKSESAAAKYRRERPDDSRSSQEDEDLARALAASRITAELDSNFSKDHYVGRRSQHPAMVSRSECQQDHSASHFAWKDMYEIEGLTEEEHLRLAILQSSEQDDYSAECCRQTPQSPSLTPPDSDAYFQPRISSNRSRRSELTHRGQESQEYERPTNFDSSLRAPWVDNPNCLYDPPPPRVQDYDRDYIDQDIGSFRADPTDDFYRNQQPARETAYEDGDEGFSHDRGGSQDLPYKSTMSSWRDTMHDTMNPYLDSGSSRGHRGITSLQNSQSKDATRHLRRPLSSRTSSSAAAPLRYYSPPPRLYENSSSNDELLSSERARYIFKGPVTINDCCRDSKHERPNDSRTTRLRSGLSLRGSSHHSYGSRDLQLNQMNQTPPAVDVRHSSSLPHLQDDELEIDRLYYSIPFSRYDDHHSRSRIPLASHRQHRPLPEQPARNTQSISNYRGLTADASLSHGSLNDWPSPRPRYVAKSPRTGRNLRRYQRSSYNVPDSQEQRRDW